MSYDEFIYRLTYRCTYTNMIFQLIPFLEYCFQWPSLYNIRGTLHLGIFLWKNELLFCLKCFLKKNYKGLAIFIPGFYSNWLTQAFYHLFNQWSMVLGMLSDLSQNHSIFCLKDEARDLIYPMLPINKIIRNDIYFYCSHGIKALQKIPT